MTGEPGPETAAPLASAGESAAGESAVASPAQEPLAPSFEDEIASALSYEKGLVLKAVLALSLVVLVIVIREFWLG